MITTIDDIIKLIESHQFPCDNLTLLSDVFHISAISISNKINYSVEREKEYMNIIKKYDEGSRCGYSTSIGGLYCKNCGAKIVNKHSEV